jgi:hypothetical protein
MNEGSLRWKARIASLRWVSLIVIVIVGLMLVVTIGDLLTAMKNPGEPQAVTIEEVVAGPIDSNQYVVLDGFAVYEIGYEETEDDVPVTSYYLLVDDVSGYLIVVEASTAVITDRVSDWTSVSGITHKTPPDLKGLIQSDLVDFQSSGFMTTSELYLAEGESPEGLTQSAWLVLFLVVVGAVSIVPFFFPVTVFAPKPVEWSIGETSPQEGQEATVRATGNFLQLRKVKPTLELGKRKRKFTSAMANIIPLEQGTLMIYIYHVVRYNFIPISKTHWGAFLDSTATGQVEPGVVYGWKDRPAVQFNDMGEGGKLESLLLIFDSAADQASFVKRIREMGFKVGTGLATPSYP